MVLRRPRTIAQTCTSTLLVPTQPLVAIAAAYSPHCAQPAHRHLAPPPKPPTQNLPPLPPYGPPPIASRSPPRNARSTLPSIYPVSSVLDLSGLSPPIDPHPRPPPRRL